MVLVSVAARHGVQGLARYRLAAATSVRCAPVTLRQLSTNPSPLQKPANSSPGGLIHEPSQEFEPKKTGFMDAIDKLGNDMFMGEIFRGVWLSMEVRIRT